MSTSVFSPRQSAFITGDERRERLDIDVQDLGDDAIESATTDGRRPPKVKSSSRRVGIAHESDCRGSRNPSQHVVGAAHPTGASTEECHAGSRVRCADQ